MGAVEAENTAPKKEEYSGVNGKYVQSYQYDH